MKECPVCGARCFDDMEVCYGCLHDFSREDTSPIGQAVPSSYDQEIEEAVMPSGDRRSVVSRFAELPTQVSGRARQSGGSVLGPSRHVRRKGRLTSWCHWREAASRP